MEKMGEGDGDMSTWNWSKRRIALLWVDDDVNVDTWNVYQKSPRRCYQSMSDDNGR